MPPWFIVPADISSCDGRGIQEACDFGCGVKWGGCTKKTVPRTWENGSMDKDLPWTERSSASWLISLSHVQVSCSSATTFLKELFLAITHSLRLLPWMEDFLNSNSCCCNCGCGLIYAHEIKIQPIQEWSWSLRVLSCRLSETVLTGSQHDSVSP